jgi:hypothetical protein
MVLHPIRVAPVLVRGRNTFDPDRVDWEWVG